MVLPVFAGGVGGSHGVGGRRGSGGGGGGVVEDASNGLLLEVTGQEHLFGGEYLMLTEMSTRLRGMGFEVRIAVGPTVGAAWAVARFGPHPLSVLGEGDLHRGLSPLPVAALRIPGALCAA